MDEILKALETCRLYVRFNHKATAWHNDPEAYEIMTNVIDPAIKRARRLKHLHDVGAAADERRT